MSKIILGLTGSVATTKALALMRALVAQRHELAIVATRSAQYFLDPNDLPELKKFTTYFLTDENEWPGTHYTRGQEIPHIALGDWAEALLIAPLDANTLAKMAGGLSDNLLTSLFRAWNFAKPIVLAPAMNTRMWDNPLTASHLVQVAMLFGCDGPTQGKSDGNIQVNQTCKNINQAGKPIQIACPVEKTLACGDFGMGAMADPADIVLAMEKVLNLTHTPPH